MNLTLSQWPGTGLIDVTLKLLLIVMLAALLAALLRRAAASTRHAVWLGAIVLLITLPVAALTWPQLELPLLPARPMAIADAPALDRAASA